MLGEVPAAFIVPKFSIDIDVTTLLAACRAVLPDYKVPVTFYTIDSIPHTASGKPKRLAAVGLLRTGTHCRPLAARLLTEELVEPLVLAESAAVCSGGLEVEHLDPDQSFMTLGLSSLTSVVLRDRLAALTGLELPVTRKHLDSCSFDRPVFPLQDIGRERRELNKSMPFSCI